MFYFNFTQLLLFFSHNSYNAILLLLFYLDYSQGGETGSRYARSLGFFDEPSWENINQKNREDIENDYEGIEMKIEKTRRKVCTHRTIINEYSIKSR